MTKFESACQTLSVFEHAGALAFSMMIVKVNNPYPKTDQFGVPEPANLAWDRGYQTAADAVVVKARPIKPYVKRAPFKRSAQPARPGNHPRFTEVRRGK